MSKAGSRILEGAKQALALTKGEADATDFRIFGNRREGTTALATGKETQLTRRFPTGTTSNNT